MRKRFIMVTIFILLFAAFGMATAAEDISEEPAITEEVMQETQETDADAEGLPTTMEEWEVYIKEEIIPVVVFIFSAVGAVYVAIMPVLTSVKKASEKFKSATKDVNKAASETEQNKNDIAALGAKMDTIAAEFAAIKTSLGNVQTIAKIGFGNFTELIEKGYAHEIEKVGESENEEETL